MTLEDLLKIAWSQEAVDRQMKMMESNAGADQVNVVGESKHLTGSEICFACGKDGHFSRDKKCPTRGETCWKCGSIGHFEVRCPPAVRQGGGELRGAARGGRRVPSQG